MLIQNIKQNIKGLLKFKRDMVMYIQEYHPPLKHNKRNRLMNKKNNY